MHGYHYFFVAITSGIQRSSGKEELQVFLHIYESYLATGHQWKSFETNPPKEKDTMLYSYLV